MPVRKLESIKWVSPFVLRLSTKVGKDITVALSSPDDFLLIKSDLTSLSSKKNAKITTRLRHTAKIQIT